MMVLAALSIASNTPATLSPAHAGDAHNWRVFIASMTAYRKPPLDLDAQLVLLEQRGLAIPDRERATHWLRQVGYYRLSAYFLPFKAGERFGPGVAFDDVAGLYAFDRKLRLLVLDAIERIEVSVRASVMSRIAEAHGPFGHVDPANFSPRFDHARFLAELAREESQARETFAAHFRAKYTAEPHLPVWMASELLSFGTVSRLYGAMSPSLKRSVAGPFGVPDDMFGTWLHALTYVRNVCAHHKRLWNRRLAILPRLPAKGCAWSGTVPDPASLYGVLVILAHALLVIAPRSRWQWRLSSLFDLHPDVALAAMGVPPDWRLRPPWVLQVRKKE
jgi:abortive infection bacteriophage resistance protein